MIHRVLDGIHSHEAAKNRRSDTHAHRRSDDPTNDDDLRFDVGFRIDLLVDDRVIVEVKAVERLLPVHTAQVVTYLKLMKLQLGILVDFNVPLIRDGIKRFVRFK